MSENFISKLTHKLGVVGKRKLKLSDEIQGREIDWLCRRSFFENIFQANLLIPQIFNKVKSLGICFMFVHDFSYKILSLLDCE